MQTDGYFGEGVGDSVSKSPESKDGFHDVVKCALLGALAVVVSALVCGIVVYSISGYSCGDAVESAFHGLDVQQHGIRSLRSWMATNFAHFQDIPVVLAICLGASCEVANAFASLTMLLLTIAILWWLWRLTGKDNAILLFALFYFTPVKYNVPQLLTACYYTQFVIGILIAFVSGILLVEKQDPGDRHMMRSPVFVALATQFLICTLMGQRMVLLVTIPMATALLAVERKRFVFAMSVMIAGAVGAGVYKFVTAPLFGVVSDISCAEDLLRFAPDFSAVLRNLHFEVAAIFTSFGFPWNANMLSVAGVLGILKFALSVLFVVLLPFFVLKNYRRQSSTDQFLIVSSLTALLLTVFLLTFGCQAKGDEIGSCARYLLLPFVMLAFAGARLARTWIETAGIAGRVAAVLLALICMVLSFSRSYSAPEYRTRSLALTAELKSAGLKKGYATYENAALPTFYSHGEVRIPHVIVTEGKLLCPRFAQSWYWYDPPYHEHQTFLLLTDDELELFAPNGLANTSLGEPCRRLKMQNLNVLVFDYDIAVNRFGGKKRR